MLTFIIYALISTAFYYLGSRAEITRAVWSRYPSPIARFMDCPACSGTWYGLLLALTLGRYQALGFLGLDPLAWFTPIVVAACTMVTTPLLAALMTHAMLVNGTAVDLSDGTAEAEIPSNLLPLHRPPDDVA